ncbi:SRPBCC family protein [Brevibacterium linens]|uniref:Cyclase/dehydrase n=1 Tax=Brevibacterium linens TaxID=1703 RepID=A0A0B9ASH2_BRELN|nr:SRPBCC family protein [Brevibacterium linens]KHS53790.1 cyclase/dehydrase [Brevibacterium linens]
MSDDSIFSGLKQQAGDFAKTLGRKAVNSVGDRVEKFADRLDGVGDGAAPAAQAGAEEIAEGESPAKAALSAATTGVKEKVKGLFGGGSSGSSGSGDFKFSNIVETAEVGVPLNVAYNAFTMFEDWPDFMKKVENVERTDDVTLSIKGQAVWSHRTWEATITEQVPDSHIVWESTGEKGYISGSISFHEVAPRLTRIIAVGEYHKQGFMEGVGALWFTVPRRFRLELKFFVHHVMRQIMLDPDSVEGWRGEIRDGELVTSHEDGLEEEQEQAEGSEDESAEDPDADVDSGVDETDPDDSEEEESDLEPAEGEAEEEYEEEEPAEDYEEEEPAEADDAEPAEDYEEEPEAADEPVEYEEFEEPEDEERR